MYTTSEDAMEADEALSFEVAKAELRNHGVDAKPSSKPGMIEAFECAFDKDGNDVSGWVTLPCRTKALLEWLGY